MARRQGKGDRVRLVSISEGAHFEIDLSRFPEAEPAFAYVDDVGTSVRVLHGLAVDRTIAISARPAFMWLKGTRKCVLLRPTAEGTRDGRASFRSLGNGEFCVEIYLVRPDGSVELLHENDFCFK